MVVQVVGLQTVDFKDKNGEAVKGVKIHFFRTPSPDESEMIVGSVVDTVFIRFENPLYKTALQLELNDLYNLVYECYGRRRASLVSIEPYQ